MNIQNRYWTVLTQFKFDYCYFNAHISRCVAINRLIKIIVAVASSVSIAAWAAWTQHAFIWGFIIAISQVISAVNELLPYKNRISELTNCVISLEPIYNDMERDWHKVASGKLTEDRINQLLYQYIQRWTAQKNRFLVNDSLPQNQKCINIAEQQKNGYFKEFFSGDNPYE